MNPSSISNSNGLLLSGKEWIVALLLLGALSAGIYFGWFHWEKFAPAADYRSECWDAKMSDYWSFVHWTRYARAQYPVYLIGDSIIWGQEVRNDETISHYLNLQSGKEIFANMGIDGLHPAAINGLVKYYGRWLAGKHVLLQCNPFWWSDRDFDLQGDWKDFFHPRLVPQFDPRIHYHQRPLEERLGYVIENHIPLFALIHHIMMKYYDNLSIDKWVLKHPYRNPLAPITFEPTPVLEKAPGGGRSWNASGQKRFNLSWLPTTESVQWQCFTKAVGELRSRKVEPFVLLGPYCSELLTPESRQRQERDLRDVRTWLDRNGVSYFEAGSNVLPSEDFADQCGHLIRPGHVRLAQRLWQDEVFRRWLNRAPASGR